MRRINWICGAVAAVVLYAGMVHAQSGGPATGRMAPGTGGLRDEVKGYFEQQKQEDKAFRSELEGLTNLDVKISEVVEHREKQYQENKAFFDKEHQKIMAKITERMAQKGRLNDTQKKEVTDFFERQYQENVSFRDTMHSDVIAFLKGLEATPNVSKEEMKSKITAYMQQEKDKIKKHREDQEAERAAFRTKMAGELKTDKTPATTSTAVKN